MNNQQIRVINSISKCLEVLPITPGNIDTFIPDCFYYMMETATWIQDKGIVLNNKQKNTHVNKQIPPKTQNPHKKAIHLKKTKTKQIKNKTTKTTTNNNNNKREQVIFVSWLIINIIYKYFSFQASQSTP